MLTISIGACQSFDNGERKYPSTIGTFNVTGDFLINTTTILDSLDRGETDVFSPTLATPSDDAILPDGSIYWTQSDYLKVANALSQFVWGEPVDGWFVYYLHLKKECDDNLDGFDSFSAIIFKPVRWGLRKMYTARYIEIYPLAGIVYWAGDTSFPVSDGWAAIDLSKFKITADDALRIAEGNGGKEARTRIQNGCSISISLPAGKNDNRWNVSYYYTANFDMMIDSYSGNYEIYIRK